jgi:hypothetical protein
LSRESIVVVTITFQSPTTEKQALAFLVGRISGRVLKTGEHLVPESAWEALADPGIPFTIKLIETNARPVGWARRRVP